MANTHQKVGTLYSKTMRFWVRNLTVISLIFSAFALSFFLGKSVLSLSIFKDISPHFWQPIESDKILTEDLLYQLIRQITVKVSSDNNAGSGIIIGQAGEVYTIVTNAHVLSQDDRQYFIETSDGLAHQATRLQADRFAHYDLGILQFSSKGKDYRVANLGSSSTLQEGDRVVAAGFPYQADLAQDSSLKFTSGLVSLIPEKSLADGYQIGYTNDIEKGMSGGPVLNIKGQVVAINGMHAYPLWGDPYVYQDGQKPCEPMRQIMERSSWAIPINTFLQLAPQFLANRIVEPLKSTNSSTESSSNSQVINVSVDEEWVSPTDSNETLSIEQQAAIAKKCQPISHH